MRKFLFLLMAVQSLWASAQLQKSEIKTEFRKLSPGSVLFALHGIDNFLFPKDINGRIPALVQVYDSSELSAFPIPFTAFGNVLTVNINPAELRILAAESNVAYIDVSFRLNRVKLLNDTARTLSHVDEVQEGLNNGLPDNYLGTGVVVGIVDVGFQPDNPTFQNGDGSQLRIKRYWHQNITQGPSPAGFSYGTEYSALADITNARDDDGTHGTHVGGIAAGSGYTTPDLKYRGMAPDADLVFVTIKYSNDSLAGSAYGDYIVANPTILDGFKYIFNYASSVSKPAVCNLSWGMHTGPHDGTSLFDKALEQITGTGKILVGSAGNEAEHFMHVGGKLIDDTTYTFAFDYSRNSTSHENVYIDAWGDSGKAFGINVSLFDTLGNALLQTPFFYASDIASYKKIFTNGIDTLWFTAAGNTSFVNNKKPEILFMVESNHSVYQRIRIGFTGQGNFHAWNSGQTYRWTSGGFSNKVKGNDKTGIYLNGTQNYCIGENGGTGNAMITAGSYVARKHWYDYTGEYRAENWLQPGNASLFSSRGPTADGRLKPDISAPGQLIASSVNYRTFPDWMKNATTLKTTYNSQDQYWTLLSGTSMAAPHVAGIVALILQANPKLDPYQIRSILQQTATRDTFTGPDSSIHFGYGKINALEAVKRAILLSTGQIGDIQTMQIFPNPADKKISIVIPQLASERVRYRITDISGKTHLHGQLALSDFGISDISTERLSDGIYIFEIENAGNFVANKIVIRH